MRGLRKLLKIAGLALLGAAIAQELGKPPNERTWRGQLDLAIPYGLTVPTPGRLREAYWNPQDDRIFTDKVLGQMNRAAARLCRRCLHELQQNPAHYDQISTYHVDLLARAIRRELDALYSCLRVDSLQMIDRSYQDWIRQGKNRKKNAPPPTAC